MSKSQDNSFVICPICNKSFKIITNSHVKRHGMDMTCFRETYPNCILESESSKLKKSKSAENAWGSEKRNNILSGLRSEESKRKMSEASVRNWGNDELREKRVKTMREVANTEESKIKFSNNSKETWKNEEFRRKRVEGIRKSVRSKEYRDRMSRISTEMWKDEEHPKKVLEGYRNSYYKKSFKYNSKLLGEINLRSSYEVTVCEYLDELNVNYEYESIRFDYYFEGKYHSYYPDFYLKDYDLILEVKPEALENDKRVLAKYNAVVNSGKKIYFVDERNIKDLTIFKDYLSQLQRLSES